MRLYIDLKLTIISLGRIRVTIVIVIIIIIIIIQSSISEVVVLANFGLFLTKIHYLLIGVIVISVVVVISVRYDVYGATNRRKLRMALTHLPPGGGIVAQSQHSARQL